METPLELRVQQCSLFPLSSDLSPSSLAPQHAQMEERGGKKEKRKGRNTLPNNAGNPQRMMAQVFAKEKKKKKTRNEVYAA